MSKCREEFERICGINQVCADGQYGEEIYEWFVFAWNARGKVDAEICQQVTDSGEYTPTQQYASAACRDAIEQGDEK